MTPHLVPFDAIGNDIRGMSESLHRNGYYPEMYAEGVHPALSGVASNLDLRTHSFWRDTNATIIYHHSMGWPLGEQILSEARCKVIIKHHNVTPPWFFRPYSEEFASSCEAGEASTRRLALIPNVFFWGDSQYNADDLIRHGAESRYCRVQAPFHWTERLTEAPISRAVIDECKQYRGTKLLFVGGLKPNKGHARLINVLKAYTSQVDPDAVLILPGGSDPRLSGYIAGLRRMAADLGVESKLVFTGSIDDSKLRTYYFCADTFLCLSEHEGFCVPLLEAMYFRTPIVTHDCTAIPETVGNAGMIWDYGDIDSIVHSIGTLAAEDEGRRALAAAGWQRYTAEYRPRQIEHRFLRLLQEAIES